MGQVTTRITAKPSPPLKPLTARPVQVTPAGTGAAAPLAQPGVTGPTAAERLDLPKLMAARHLAVQACPYLAGALYAMTVVPSGLAPTMAVDRFWRCYVSPEFVRATTVPDLAFVWLHEVSHLVRDHHRRAEALMERSKNHPGPGSPPLDPEQPARERMRMNLAMDCEINDDLLGNVPLAATLGLSKPAHAFTHRQLTNGALKVPDCDLFEQYIRHMTPSMLSRIRWLDCGSGAHGGYVPWELEDESEAPISEYEGAAIRIRVREAVKGAPGTVPKGWRRWAEGHCEAAQDWRVLLSGAFRSALAVAGGATDYAYQRPGRRTSSLGGAVVLPSLRRPVPRVAVIVDTSGSVSDRELGSALTEVAQIAKAVGVGGNRVSVYSCDSAVHTVQMVCSCEEIALVGGGGTNMVRGIMRAAAASPRPDVIVVLTDGYTPWPGEMPGPRVVAGIFGKPPTRYSEDSTQVRAARLPPAWVETVYLR
jgi:predicted metal-dependent peptidase